MVPVLIQNPNLLFPRQLLSIIIFRRLSVDVVWLQLLEPASLHHNISGAKIVGLLPDLLLSYNPKNEYALFSNISSHSPSMLIT